MALRCDNDNVAARCERSTVVTLFDWVGPGAVMPPGIAVVTAGFNQSGGPCSNVFNSDSANLSRLTGKNTCTGTSICWSGRRKYTYPS